MLALAGFIDTLRLAADGRCASIDAAILTESTPAKAEKIA
jgi:hypothetical protein